MKENEYIYNFLIYLEENGEIHYSYIDNINDEDGIYEDSKILDVIQEHDVIRSKTGYFEFDSIVYITENGKNVLKFNSWNDYIESLNKIKQSEVKKNIRKETQEEIIRKETISEFDNKRIALYILIASTAIALLSWLTQRN